MKAIWINSATRAVREVEYGGLADLQRMVGGYIELAHRWPHGDVLFVDEDGLSKPQAAFFRLLDFENPIAGNGVIVGRETDLDSSVTADPTLTVPEVVAMIRFVTREQADAWGKANASEPAVIVHFKGGEPEVLQTYGSLFAEIPPVEEGPEATSIKSEMPGYWMNETSGVLRPAVEAYLEGGLLTSAQIAALRAYLRQWIAAPAWRGDGIAELRKAVDELTSRGAIKEWLDRAMELNIDPL